MIVLMRLVLVLFLSFLTPTLAFAYQAEFPAFESYEQFEVVEKPTIRRSYFATLDNFPHTYQINLLKETELSLKLFEPKSDNNLKNQGIMIVRQKAQGVEEVKRVSPKKATWEKMYSVTEAETYLHGVTYEATLPAGSYLLEVSTPDNVGPYVLRIGKDKPIRLFGYFRDLSDLYHIKKWRGESTLGMVFSPLVYLPLLLLLAAGLVWVRYNKKNA